MGAELVEFAVEVACLALLSYAAYSDYKTRLVDDRVWLCMAALAPLTLYVVWVARPRLLATYIASLAAGLTLGLVIGATKLAGGADAKAVMALSAVTVPKGPSPLLIPSLAVLLNGVILSLVTIPYVLARNSIEYARRGRLFDDSPPLRVRAALVLIAFRERLGRVAAEPHKYFIVEDRRGGARRYRLCLVSAEEDTAQVVREMMEGGVSEEELVWVSPSIPLIVYILLGYAYYIAWGNVLAPILSALLG